MAKADLTAARLREVFHYDPSTGVFTRLVSAAPNAMAGDKAGCETRSCAYIRIGVDGLNYRAHRLAFLWMTGSWPAQHVDHIDGNPKNNAWENLRDVPRSVNLQNVYKARRDASTGILGVTHTPTGRWKARIGAEGRQHHLGHFNTAEDAYAAYLAAKARLHPTAPVANGAGPAPAPVSIDGVSGLRGVYPYRKKWVARIYLNRKPKHLGVFQTPEDARRAYLAAQAQHAGERVSDLYADSRGVEPVRVKLAK